MDSMNVERLDHPGIMPELSTNSRLSNSLIPRSKPMIKLITRTDGDDLIFFLFVCSIAQRRLRANLQTQNKTLPNQIDRPMKQPTRRWVFQLFEGIHLITLINKTGTKTMIDRFSD